MPASAVMHPQPGDRSPSAAERDDLLPSFRNVESLPSIHKVSAPPKGSKNAKQFEETRKNAKDCERVQVRMSLPCQVESIGG